MGNYSLLDMQRFNLTFVSNEQVRLCFQEADQNEYYYQVSEQILAELSSSPDLTLEIFSNETPDAEEDQFVPLLQEYFQKLNLSDFQDQNFGLVNLTACEENPHERYVYYFHFDKSQKKLIVISTVNQRKFHQEFVEEFHKFANKEGYSMELFMEFPRVLFINSCPEIFLAFCLQKIVEEATPFLEVFKTFAFNSVPFILEDSEGSEMILSSDQGIPSHLDSAKSKCFISLNLRLFFEQVLGKQKSVQKRYS